MVGARWGEAEWSAWKDFRDRLAALGVPATHVKPVGPLDRPTDLSAHTPSLAPWVSVPVDWQRFGDEDALLHAFGDSPPSRRRRRNVYSLTDTLGGRPRCCRGMTGP
ncbi:MAG TPA: hypothetical protein VFJ60_10630 [Gaiella sp.]|nr:hypothetical protein [Gaiella sp.]